MYGTVARFMVKPGTEQKLRQQLVEFEGLNVPGYIGSMLYKMDENANEYYMAVVFRDKDAYFTNADSPEQDARYRQMLEVMEGEPEWHDGEIIYARPM